MVAFKFHALSVVSKFNVNAYPKPLCHGHPIVLGRKLSTRQCNRAVIKSYLAVTLSWQKRSLLIGRCVVAVLGSFQVALIPLLTRFAPRYSATRLVRLPLSVPG